MNKPAKMFGLLKELLLVDHFPPKYSPFPPENRYIPTATRKIYNWYSTKREEKASSSFRHFFVRALSVQMLILKIAGEKVSGRMQFVTIFRQNIRHFRQKSTHPTARNKG
jgi:hypothetical protein